jgi:hypothetical protein
MVSRKIGNYIIQGWGFFLPNGEISKIPAFIYFNANNVNVDKTWEIGFHCFS